MVSAGKMVLFDRLLNAADASQLNRFIYSICGPSGRSINTYGTLMGQTYDEVLNRRIATRPTVSV